MSVTSISPVPLLLFCRQFRIVRIRRLWAGITDTWRSRGLRSGLSRALGPSDSTQRFRQCGNHVSELLTVEAIYPRAAQVDLLEAGHRGTRGRTSQSSLCP